MSKESKLTPARMLRVHAEIAKLDSGEMEAVLSHKTVSRIEQGVPVTYRSAVLYCRSLGLDPDEYILKRRVIPIIEIIDDALTV